jgi:WD40 repeat protein
MFLIAVVLSPHARADEPLGVRAVAFSPDRKLLAAGTGEPKEQGSVTLWEVATGKQGWRHQEKDGVPGVAFSPDGKLLAISVYDGAAKLFDVATGEVKQTLKHPREVRGIAFSPDGELLATTCWDGLVRVWDLATGTEKVTCKGHTDRVFGVAYSPNGKLLLSAGGNDGAKLWDAATGKEKHTFKNYYIPTVQFTADGRWAFTGSYDGTTRLWNVETGEQRAVFGGTGGIYQLAFSEAARTLAVCEGRSVTLFDLTLDAPTAKELDRIRGLLVKLDDDSYEIRKAASKELVQVGFIAEAALRKAAKEGKSVEVRLRARRLREEILSTPRARLQGHTDEVEALAFSPDSKLLASGGKDGTVRVWNMTTTKEIARLSTTSK